MFIGYRNGRGNRYDLKVIWQGSQVHLYSQKCKFLGIRISRWINNKEIEIRI